MDYDKLSNLDYTAYDHAKELERGIEAADIDCPVLSLDYHIDDCGVPVVLAEVYGRVSENIYMDSYRLEGVTEKEFEEVMYDIWVNAFSESVDCYVE